MHRSPKALSFAQSRDKCATHTFPINAFIFTRSCTRGFYTTRSCACRISSSAQIPTASAIFLNGSAHRTGNQSPDHDRNDADRDRIHMRLLLPILFQLCLQAAYGHDPACIRKKARGGIRPQSARFRTRIKQCLPFCKHCFLCNYRIKYFRTRNTSISVSLPSPFRSPFSKGTSLKYALSRKSASSRPITPSPL